ncbi:integrase, catalytic region, zinc finger, CCHC-type containing protein [Tanacetum coccineum]
MANTRRHGYAVSSLMGTVHFGNDQFAPILGYGDLVQGNITIKRVYYVKGLNHNLFSVRQFCDADLEVAFQKLTCIVRDLQGNDLLTSNCGSDLYTISLQETTSPTPICFLAKASPIQAWLWHRRLSHHNFDTINLLSKKDIVIGLPKVKYEKDHLCSSCELDTQPSADVQTTTKLITPTTTVTAQENNTEIQVEIQAEDAQIDENEVYNIFSTPIRKEAESSTWYVDLSNMHIFYQRRQSEHRWTKDHPIEQVRGNPSKRVQTIRQLATDPKMYVFALTVSTTKLKNIKEVMADSAWIEEMQDELY